MHCCYALTFPSARLACNVTHNSRVLLLTRHDPLLPARRYASAGLCDSNVSVCLTVRLSVTSRYCVKTKKASVVISSLPGSPKTLVVFI